MKLLHDLFDYLKIDFIQFAVLILGVTEVLLARANNVWLYPAGIGSIVLSMYSLFEVKLYAECILQLYYLIMSIYGWSYWLTKKDNSVVPITVTTQREWMITMSIIVFGWLILFYFLLSFTDSQNPVWDASVACTGWAGMFLLARRKVENWILLNISNAIAIPLLIMKGLTLFAVLTVILFVVACKGYFDWAKQARKQLETS